MKILITEKQVEKLFGDKIKCRCGHSWVKEKKDQHPYLCHMCGWDQKYEKYKRSIDCYNPKGFSQKAHCQGKKNKIWMNMQEH